MRTRHLTSDEISGYQTGAMDPADVVEISDHLFACADCRERVLQAKEKPRGGPPESVGYEELVAYVDDELDPVERRVVGDKLRVSPAAQRELIDLQKFKREMAISPLTSPFRSYTRWILPMAAAVMLAAVFGWWAIQQQKKQDIARDLSPDLRETMQVALARHRFAFPAAIEQLRQGREHLAGDSLGRHPGLKLVSPVGTAITTQRPVFRWIRIDGATGYRLHFAVQNQGATLETVELSGAETSFTPAKPLAEGQTYEWQVQAIRNGEILEQAPAPPEPEALFYVLDPKQQREIAQARGRFGRSHLALGLINARAGLIDDAKEEFRTLQQESPQSDLPQKLSDALETSRTSD